MVKIPTTLILAIITIVELFFTKCMLFSTILWLGYGWYKIEIQ